MGFTIQWWRGIDKSGDRVLDAQMDYSKVFASLEKALAHSPDPFRRSR